MEYIGILVKILHRNLLPKMFEIHEFVYSPPFTQKETVKQIRKCTLVTSLGLQLPRAEAGQAARSYDTLFPLDF